MGETGKAMGNPAEELLRNRAAIAKLAASPEARQLMGLLGQMGGVEQAARSAAGGDTGALKAMVEGLMQTAQGAELTRRIEEQARKAGLE